MRPVSVGAAAASHTQTHTRRCSRRAGGRGHPGGRGAPGHTGRSHTADTSRDKHLHVQGCWSRDSLCPPQASVNRRPVSRDINTSLPPQAQGQRPASGARGARTHLQGKTRLQPQSLTHLRTAGDHWGAGWRRVQGRVQSGSEPVCPARPGAGTDRDGAALSQVQPPTEARGLPRALPALRVHGSRGR